MHCRSFGLTTDNLCQPPSYFLHPWFPETKLCEILATHLTFECIHVHSSNVYSQYTFVFPLKWRHNWHCSVSNHQPHDCLLNRLFRRRSRKTSKLCVTGLCAGNSPWTGEFPEQMASKAENVPIWWRHHAILIQSHAVYASHWKMINECLYICNISL